MDLLNNLISYNFFVPFILQNGISFGPHDIYKKID